MSIETWFSVKKSVTVKSRKNRAENTNSMRNFSTKINIYIRLSYSMILSSLRRNKISSLLLRMWLNQVNTDRACKSTSLSLLKDFVFDTWYTGNEAVENAYYKWVSLLLLVAIFDHGLCCEWENVIWEKILKILNSVRVIWREIYFPVETHSGKSWNQ